MPRFEVYPTDNTVATAEILAPDAAGVFRVVERLGSREADVTCDGVYEFSIKLAPSGLWCIFQRQGLTQAIPLNG